MTSQFAYSIHQKRHELIEELVSHLLHVQVCALLWHTEHCCLNMQGMQGPGPSSATPYCCFPCCRSCVMQPEDENYGLARDFCLQKAYYNSFPDVHSGATEEYYAE